MMHKLIRRAAPAVMAAMLGSLTPLSSAMAADSLLNWSDLSSLKIYHAYSGSDGFTHIEQIALPSQQVKSGGAKAEIYFNAKTQEVHIARSDSGSMIDWHYAGESRHLIIPMQGDIVFDLGDGKLFHLKAGEAIYAEDWSGKGHRSGCDATNKQTCVVIDVLVDANPRALPLRTPPK